MLSLCALLIQACQKESVDLTSDQSPTAQRLLDALIQDDSSFMAPGLPQLPQDLGTHLSAQTESFQLQAILWPASKPGDDIKNENKLAIIASIDRVALTPESKDLQSTDSQWRYTGIMRSQVLADTALTIGPEADSDSGERSLAARFANLSTVERTQSVQRMALNLAGANDDSLWVGDDQLTILRDDGGDNHCERLYRWQLALSLAERAELDVTIDECPVMQALGEFNGWRQSSAAVTGVLISQASERESGPIPLLGAVWLSQGWGNLPADGGAVVIDLLQLRLDDFRWLSVSRSKRRSGRGPKSVSATIHGEGAAPVDVSVTWQDSRDEVLSTSGVAYPANIELRSDDQELALTVTVMNRLLEADEVGENRLDAPVTVTGTHSGAGFLSFTSLKQ